MFKLVRGFFDKWFLVPFDSPGLSVLGLVIVGLLSAKFFELSGPAIILPAILAFLIPFLASGLCDKLFISRCWLCVLHGYFIQRLIDAVTVNAINGNPQGLGLINLVFLFILLLIGCMFLISLASDGGFLIFFVILVTNGLYYLSRAVHEIKFMSSIAAYSIIIQVIIVVISQILLLRKKSKQE